MFESGGISAEDGAESDLQNEEAVEMEDVIAPERVAPPPPASQLARMQAGEAEWMRNPLSRDTAVRLLVTGTMGSREIGKLIKLLEAQKAVLDDEDDPDDI